MVIELATCYKLTAGDQAAEGTFGHINNTMRRINRCQAGGSWVGGSRASDAGGTCDGTVAGKAR